MPGLLLSHVALRLGVLLPRDRDLLGNHLRRVWHMLQLWDQYVMNLRVLRLLERHWH